VSRTCLGPSMKSPDDSAFVFKHTDVLDL
jgi:hypothetical protein